MTDPESAPAIALGDFLDSIAAAAPAAATGTVAAASTAMAAGLVAMCGRRSRDRWAEAAATIGQAERLRARATALIEEAGPAYAEAVDRLGRRGEDGERSAEQRDWDLGVALRRAAELPLRCAELAADVAELAADARRSCDPACAPDASAACRIAESAALIGARLVEVNLAVGADEKLRARAESAIARAGVALARASALDRA